MIEPQMRLRDLLKNDPIYKAWFMKPPKITNAHSGIPWRLFVQREEGGPWARKDLRGYPEAYSQVKLRLSETHDMTIHCKPQHFQPPVVKIKGVKHYNPVPFNHTWCSLCRRPTRSIFVERHPNFGKKYTLNAEEPRCLICGCRRVGMKEYHSSLSWPLVIRSQPLQ